MEEVRIEPKLLIETVGVLNKLEHLNKVSERSQHANATVLECQDIFPQYYGIQPGIERPEFIYILTKKQYPIENVIRLGNRIKLDLGLRVDLAVSELTLKGARYHAIRLRGVDAYWQVPEIQVILENSGIELHRGGAPEADYRVSTTKTYSLNEMDEGIYLESQVADFGYFHLPMDLNWDQFVETTHRVRYNWDGPRWDAAQASIIRNQEVENLVRIYSHYLSVEMLQSLRQLYYRFSS